MKLQIVILTLLCTACSALPISGATCPSGEYLDLRNQCVPAHNFDNAADHMWAKILLCEFSQIKSEYCDE